MPSTTAPVELIDIDPTSPELGTAYPIVAATLPPDDYVNTNMVAASHRAPVHRAPRRTTKYAYVIRNEFAPGFGPPAGFTVLAQGNTPAGALGTDAAALYAPLWPALATAGIPQDDVLVATVFTTGDEVARVRARSEAIRTMEHPTIDGLHLVNGDTYDGFCRLDGTITMPQYQTGTAPFGHRSGDVRWVDAQRRAELKQGTMTIPVSSSRCLKLAMPAGGFPLYQFFHGSGGLSSGLVDLGHVDADRRPRTVPIARRGPGATCRRRCIGIAAAASSALPLNPERLAGATDYEYLNINNLAAFPFTFQQGTIEQRLFTDALLATSIDPTLLTGCTGISTPVTDYHFDATKLVAGGQSMGGMYTNVIGSVEDRFGALVPTGAGGFWNLMILETAIIAGRAPAARARRSSASTTTTR